MVIFSSVCVCVRVSFQVKFELFPLVQFVRLSDGENNSDARQRSILSLFLSLGLFCHIYIPLVSVLYLAHCASSLYLSSLFLHLRSLLFVVADVLYSCLSLSLRIVS